MKKVAILQSNYIPWKGYFDIIALVDEFIIYDEVQYTNRDWRNRNKIKTPDGLKWLSIPVNTKGHMTQSIKIADTTICDTTWAKSHYNTLCLNYRKAPYFKEYKELFASLYNECTEEKYLSKINYKIITVINKILNIDTKITFSSDYTLIDGKTERLVNLCKQAKATEYISGPAAKDYIIPELFEQENIQLTWFDYANYPEYTQLYGNFEHYVSILDLIFNCGENAKDYMKYVR